MPQYLSDKIKVCSFISIILVLYIHSDFHETRNEIQGMCFNIMLQTFISEKIGRLAVPLFFMISGYLFFVKVIGIKDVLKKQKKRIKTLLIPYIIAALFLPLFYTLLLFIPWASKYVNSSNNGFFEGNILDVLYRLYIDSGTGSPYGFHLWFLRDLVLIVILSPILFYLRQLDKRGYVVCLLLVLISFFDIPFISSLFWFLFGNYAINKMDIKNNVGAIILLVVYIIICVVEVWIPISSEDYYLEKLIEVIGVWAFWNAYNLCFAKSFKLAKYRLVEKACGFTFFVYLYHEPTINIVRKLLVLPFGKNEYGFAISYIMSPWIFAIIAIVVGIVLKKFSTRIYRICIGGR